MRHLLHKLAEQRRLSSRTRPTRERARQGAAEWSGVETLEPRLLLSGDVSTLWGVDEDDGQLFSIDDYTQISSGAAAAGLTSFGELKYDRNTHPNITDIRDFGDQTQIESDLAP